MKFNFFAWKKDKTGVTAQERRIETCINNIEQNLKIVTDTRREFRVFYRVFYLFCFPPLLLISALGEHLKSIVFHRQPKWPKFFREHLFGISICVLLTETYARSNLLIKHIKQFDPKFASYEVSKEVKPEIQAVAKQFEIDGIINQSNASEIINHLNKFKNALAENHKRYRLFCLSASAQKLPLELRQKIGSEAGVYYEHWQREVRRMG